jgi:hypothetical protein
MGGLGSEIESTLLGGRELDDVLEVQITSLRSDHILTNLGIAIPICEYFYHEK